MAADSADASPAPAGPPRRSPVLWIIIGVLLVGMVFLNVLSQQFRPKTDEEEAAEAREKAAAASPAPAASAAAPAAPGDASALVTLGDPAAPGQPPASPIVIGFEWTPQVQADPSKVTAAVDALKKGMGGVPVKVVNVDQDPSVPEGVSVAGKTVIPAGADGSIPAGPEVIAAARAALGGGPPAR